MKLSDAKIRAPEPLTKEETTSSNKRVSILSDNVRGEFLKIPIEKLKPFKKQARTFFDTEEIAKLADSIKRHGIRQPLTVTAVLDDSGFYEVISGERRLRAAQVAGLDRVPCIILEYGKSADEIALIENIQREDLHIIELADALSKLYESGEYTNHENLAFALGLSRSKVSELISISSLPIEIKTSLLNLKPVSRKLIRNIMSKSTVSEMKMILGTVTDENIHEEDTTSDSPKKNVEGNKTKNMASRRPVLLRVSVGDSGVEVFTSKLYLLKAEDKEKLKGFLDEIMQSL